jgi:hypothetical protein
MIEWLRAKKVETRTPIHTLRKEFGSLINQQFCEQAWKDVQFINREQDLGEEGLRRAKMSYYPEHLEEKFRIGLD